MEKTSICVLFGGKSGEHEVSLRSAYSVLEAIDESKYIIHKIGITREGEWYLFKGDNRLILEDKWQGEGENTPICVDFCQKHLLIGGEKLRPDVVFPVLHGAFGEDGRIQALLELLEIPYIGCNSASSALCMDKVLCKGVAMQAFVPVVPYIAVTEREYKSNTYECDLEGDVFVKPSSSGSSLGISRARGAEQIECALGVALRHSPTALVERAIEGAECEVAVTEINGKAVASEVGQISYKADFYDYETKYHSSAVKYKIPAKISRECRNLCKKYALDMFYALGCSGLCRMDFFVTRDEEIYFNEVNTLPGFTSGSMYPMLLKRQGYDMRALVDLLVSEALRHKNT